VRGRDGERGVTLVESIVSMVIGSAIGAMVLSAIVSGLRSQTRVDSHQTSLEQTRVAVQRITREIRNLGGYKSLLTAQYYDIAFNQARPSGYRTVEFTTVTSASSTTLVMLTTDFVPNNSGSPCTIDPTMRSGCTTQGPKTTPMLTSLANVASNTPLFTYSRKDGYSDPNVDPTTCIWAGHTPTQAAVECPGAVNIDLQQLISKGRANQPTDVKDTVQLRNQSS
jgi:hypothetical protein